MQVEFIFFTGCPNADAARDRLRTALERTGRAMEGTEWDTGDGAAPPRGRGFASPTILVNGVDVEGKTPVTGAGCALGGGPTIEHLVRALRAESA